MANTPELSAILARLAQYSQSAVPRQLANSSQEHQTPASSLSFGTPEPTFNHNGTAHPLIAEDSSTTRAVIDPATITTWQEGIRCVTKIAAENRQFGAQVRKMIQDQRAAEMRWYAERQELRRVQAARTQSSAQALEILDALNPDRSNKENGLSTQKSAAEELSNLDKRIYQAQLDFHANTSSRLKTLGVPFFGMPASLVREEQSVATQEEYPKYGQPITQSQLNSLRKRMVAHLEDLYRD